MIKAFINSLIPPILKKSLTNFQTRMQKKPEPKWVLIDQGPLQGLNLFIDPDSNLGAVMVHNYDDFIYNSLPDVSKIKSPVFYDIGSHFGFHTLGFSVLAGKNGKVYSFEPHPLNRERLYKNISANKTVSDRIVVIDQALTDLKGIVTFEMITDIESGWSSSSKIIGNDKNAIETGVKRHIQVNTDSIDNLVEKNEILKPDIIKIDVEGEEFKVLIGAKKTIEAFKPALYIEIHSMECMFLVQKFLYDRQYTVELIHKEADGRCFIKGIAADFYGS